jgi:hypothetical protein
MLRQPLVSSAAVNDEELAHQPVVLVPQEMAVVDVRGGLVRVVLEPHDHQFRAVRSIANYCDTTLDSKGVRFTGGDAGAADAT